MFNLSKEELMGKQILDCPAGACSFTAIGNKLKMDITACDIAYDHPYKELEKKGLEDLEHAIFHIEKAKRNYIWKYFGSVDDLKRIRLTALNDCIKDMEESQGERYIPVMLPQLPFEDDEFDLTLSAHFLFMYANQ